MYGQQHDLQHKMYGQKHAKKLSSNSWDQNVTNFYLLFTYTRLGHINIAELWRYGIQIPDYQLYSNGK